MTTSPFRLTGRRSGDPWMMSIKGISSILLFSQVAPAAFTTPLAASWKFFRHSATALEGPGISDKVPLGPGPITKVVTEATEESSPPKIPREPRGRWLFPALAGVECLNILVTAQISAAFGSCGSLRQNVVNPMSFVLALKLQWASHQ